MACWYSCSLVRDTGPSGQTPSDNGMFTSDSCRGGWDEVGGADVLLRMMSVGDRPLGPIRPFNDEDGVSSFLAFALPTIP